MPRKTAVIPTPTLDRLVKEGVVMWDAMVHQWVGRASDGVWVVVGHDAASAERYLSAHPDPKEW